MEIKKEFKWVEDLVKEGYTTFMMPKRNKTSFYSSKSPAKTKKGVYRNNSNWDLYKLVKGESWPKFWPKDTFIEVEL